MARTAKTTLDIYDNGILIGSASSLDFEGAGVSGSYDSSTGRATETITGGGGSGTTPVFGEVVSGGPGTTFTLAHIPVGTVSLEINGQGASIGNGDYTISGTVITTGSSWPAGAVLASYQY